jgi:HEPN domain-containing protein
LIEKKVGEWPKTHYLNELVRELSKVYKEKEIINYYKKTSYSLRT